MTTAHKPTFHPALGTINQGGYRYHVKRSQYSSRDLPGQLTLKVRETGQNNENDIKKRDLLKELETKENEYNNKKKLELQRQGMLDEPVDENELRPNHLALTLDNILKDYDDSDNSDSDDDDDDQDSDLDSEDEEEALQRELKAIREEKAKQKAKQEELERKRQMEDNSNEIRLGNPLLRNKLNDKNNNFNIKRSWTEDSVFKNQAPPLKKQKRFINDTIRSDFHRKFMDKYIK